MKISKGLLVRQAIARVYSGSYQPTKRGGTVIEVDGFAERYLFDGEEFDPAAFKEAYEALTLEVADSELTPEDAAKYLKSAEASKAYTKALEELSAYDAAKLAYTAAALELRPDPSTLKQFKEAIKLYLGANVLAAIKKEIK